MTMAKDEYADINNILTENKEVLENKDSELRSKILELMERDKNK
jgi:hypothetical protein